MNFPFHPLLNNIRVGHRYQLTNHGEKFDFEVIRRKSEQDYFLKDIHTLETYTLLDLVKYGTSRDFEFEEI